ncbi:MAG: tRNA (guanosine(37)-N1)-methyltransferase TrmD [Candidatus Hydrogenedentota bacterium]|nr:MAG: tRNA (guanosine(37)-N1)-methyltransferase TrmD [Candidatus Hydrogenedentota bacterium]
MTPSFSPPPASSSRATIFEILAVFPEILEVFLRASLIGKAVEAGILHFRLNDLRNFASDRHRTIDDRPFGGGAGMVLKPEPLFKALEEILGREPEVPTRLLLFSPRGRRLTQKVAEELAAWENTRSARRFVLICGRYEGIDQRVIDHFRPEELSIGDYVIAGGEVAAMVLIEAVARLIPGVVGNPESLKEESHSTFAAEYPHYTRPAEFRGMRVPDVLLSGNHEAIAAWRRRHAEGNKKE